LVLTKHIRLTVAVLLAAAIAGCSTTRISQSPRDIDPFDVQKLKLGETAKEEVISLMGPPVAVTINSKGFEVYTFVAGSSLSQVWQIPPILVFYVDAVSSAKTKVLTVTFSGNTVIDWSYTVSSAGGGFQAGNVQGGTIDD